MTRRAGEWSGGQSLSWGPADLSLFGLGSALMMPSQVFSGASMSSADRHERLSCVNNRNPVQSASFCWFLLNNQMLVLRPSMIDLIVHLDSPFPSLSLSSGFFSETAKSKMLAPSVFSGALLTDMLPAAQCPEYIRVTTFQWTPEAGLVYHRPRCA